MDKEPIIIGALIATVFITIFALAFLDTVGQRASINAAIQAGADPLVASCAYGG